ncbi:MAG: Undecaprenyl-diphosphatase [Campylobacterota bacterium]|nr:Undecaprenyl-diphosphatase [Campylobacterota bacterium]
MTVLDAIILGTLEGLTEFLPISSTGHLILASKLLGLEQSDAHKTFEVSIQLGSILAVLFIYSKKLLVDKTLWLKVIVAFLPTAIFGFLFYKTIKSLFGIETVSVMLIVGGILFLLVEFFRLDKKHNEGKGIEELSLKESFVIGLFQSVSMVPGTSRSGMTILGGIFSGLKRKSAAEFSFLLAVPTMFVATFYDIYKNMHTMVVEDYTTLAIGFGLAFIVAFFTVNAMIRFLENHTFVIFGIYRIIVGLIFWFLVV